MQLKRFLIFIISKGSITSKYVCQIPTYYSYIHTLLKSHSLNRIKEVLEDKQLTQVQLGEMIGKSFETVNAYVQNRRQPSVETLYSIAMALCVEPRELLLELKDLNKKK
jgi:putative transcriptional regulator